MHFLAKEAAVTGSWVKIPPAPSELPLIMLLTGFATEDDTHGNSFWQMGHIILGA